MTRTSLSWVKTSARKGESLVPPPTCLVNSVPERVIDTPISETGFIGAGIGAAVEGLRPVVELMFIDFYGVCMDQITNHMAKIHYESGGNVKVPMVLMAATGAGYSDAAQHSQCLWGTFAHLPGIKLVVPSNPYDAKGLMISAIQDDNPVLYLFHKGAQGLVWMEKNPRSIGAVPEESFTVPIGKAAVAREGTDVTIVTLSLSVQHSLDVAEQLEGEGISVEVIRFCAARFRSTTATVLANWSPSTGKRRSSSTRTTESFGLDRRRSPRVIAETRPDDAEEAVSVASPCPTCRSRMPRRARVRGVLTPARDKISRQP